MPTVAADELRCLVLDRLRRLFGLSRSVRGPHRSIPASVPHLSLRPHAHRRANHTLDATTADPRHLVTYSLPSPVPPIGSPRSEPHGCLTPRTPRRSALSHRPDASARHCCIASAHHRHPLSLAAPISVHLIADPELRTNPHSASRAESAHLHAACRAEGLPLPLRVALNNGGVVDPRSEKLLGTRCSLVMTVVCKLQLQLQVERQECFHCRLRYPYMRTGPACPHTSHQAEFC